MSKLCKDCRWIKLPTLLMSRVSDIPISMFAVLCEHPTSSWTPNPDRVFGNPRPVEQLPCHEVRQDRERCGPEGKYWETVSSTD